MNQGKERELSVCIWVHHIATFAAITEGIYYLAVKKQRFLHGLEIFLFTLVQFWAGVKILKDVRNGRSRLAKSYNNLEKLVDGEKKRRGILWGLTLFSVLFKVLPAQILGHS